MAYRYFVETRKRPFVECIYYKITFTLESEDAREIRVKSVCIRVWSSRDVDCAWGERGY